MKKQILKQLALNVLLTANPMCCAAVASSPTQKKEIGEKQFYTKTIKVGNCTMNYNISQRRHKKTIILQHGAFLNNLSMMGLACLFRGYNVIVPDMAGHGKSVMPCAIESVEQLADIEYNFILKLKETGEILDGADITYAGWSLGTSIGLEMALKEQIFDRLILISGSPIWNTVPAITVDQFEPLLHQIVSQGLSEYTTPERVKWINENLNAMSSTPQSGVDDFAAARKFNVIDKLKEISMPVLMISGSIDNLALPESELTLVEDMQNTKLVIIGNETHMMVLGCPETVYSEIIKFIEPKKY